MSSFDALIVKINNLTTTQRSKVTRKLKRVLAELKVETTRN